MRSRVASSCAYRLVTLAEACATKCAVVMVVIVAVVLPVVLVVVPDVAITFGVGSLGWVVVIAIVVVVAAIVLSVTFASAMKGDIPQDLADIRAFWLFLTCLCINTAGA